uniref:Posterior midgut dominant protein n=1 Tax=Coptosoma parvipictum TaxID=355286 RepID=A0A8E4BSM2_9HEMI|nr:posterior midgut dominant protein [Coptosoma parvipictum]
MKYTLYLLAMVSLIYAVASYHTKTHDKHDHDHDHHDRSHSHDRDDSRSDDSRSDYSDDRHHDYSGRHGHHHGHHGKDRHHEYFKKNLREALKCCASEHDVDTRDIFKALKNKGHSDTHAAKCAIGCWLDKMGYIKNKKICWESIKKDAQNLYEDEEEVEKAHKVVDEVSEQWREKITDKCREPVRALRFLLKKAKKSGLSKPDYHFKYSRYDESSSAAVV